MSMPLSNITDTKSYYELTNNLSTEFTKYKNHQTNKIIINCELNFKDASDNIIACEVSTFTAIEDTDNIPKVTKLIGVARNIELKKTKDNAATQYGSKLHSIIENCNDAV
jgi:hypothetical protein